MLGKWNLKAHLLVIIIMGLLCLILKPPAVSFGTGSRFENPIYAVFCSSGGTLREIKVCGWAKLNNELMSIPQLEKIVNAGKERLDGGRETYRENVSNKYLRGVTKEFESENNVYQKLTVTAQSLNAYPGTENSSPQSYVLIDFRGRGKPELLDFWKDKVEKFFKLENTHPSLSISVCGVLEGNLSPKQSREIIRKMLHIVGARQVEYLIDDKYCSVSAYTPLIADYVTAGGRKINLNLALRYHEIEGLTYVEVGSPLLDGEY